MLKRIVLILLIIHFIVACSKASGSWQSDFTIETVQGIFSLQTDEEIPEYNTRILIGDIIVKNYESINAEVYNYYPNDLAKIVIISKPTGGSGCPSLFEIIDLTIDGVFISEEFGGCSDQPEINISKDNVEIMFPTSTNAIKKYEYKIGSSKISH